MLLYTNSGHTICQSRKDFLDNDLVIRFKCRTVSDEDIATTKESLCAPDSPDVGWIPSNVPEMKQASSEFSDKVVADRSNHVQLSPLQ